MTSSPSFKQRLHGGTVQYGFFVNAPAPATVEIAGYTGFDFVIIDNEHGAIGLEMVEHMLRAAAAANIKALVRVPSAAPEAILHVLDAGAEGIMVPHVTSAAQAEQIVKNAYYPPLGKRGISTIARAARHGAMDPATFLRDRADRTAVIAMIEDAEALPEVDAIARVRGIDALFVGPNDLAASIGHINDADHPEVGETIAGIQAVLAERRRAEVDGPPPAFATIGRSADHARLLAAQGAAMICFNTSFILLNALRSLRTALGPATRP